MDEIYKSDFLLLTTESLIRAIETRLDRKPAGIQQSLAEGFILTPFFGEALPAYEKQETAMRMHFPDMMALDGSCEKEVKRLDAVDLTVRRRQTRRPATRPRPPSHRELAEKTIDEARAVYTKPGISIRPARRSARLFSKPRSTRCTHGSTMVLRESPRSSANPIWRSSYFVRHWSYPPTRTLVLGQRSTWAG